MSDSTTQRAIACQASLSTGFSRQEYWSRLLCPPPGNLPHSGVEPMSPTLRVESLPSEPPGKPKNTGVGSLSLFQQIFLTQELNQGLLYCRQILYQLSCQGSPISYIGIIYAYEKLDSKVFASVKSHEGFTDLAYTLLPIFPWF